MVFPKEESEAEDRVDFHAGENPRADESVCRTYSRMNTLRSRTSNRPSK